MSRNEKPAKPQPLLRLSGLLVLGLLIGLLGMHGLGFAPAAAQESTHGRSAEIGRAAAVLAESDECGHDCHGQHEPADHADPTCASGAVAGPLVFPALVPTVIGHPLPAEGQITALSSGPDGGRAPPSLSELQLLRI
ncbi:DUF6153 family protein [Streptomyces sp. NBC_00239]|uniref:DUF6153 family protein n=1 Tax=Streptomyces sp. NBC_00239 TaxID=2903640 RepID=UPI002E29640C|nr:DUF6153 family protein [Streptomyces sp. NBC_00239]